MISVCMATYNGEKYLEAQLNSILPQLKEGDELIISDDGSSDGTMSILSALPSDNVRIFQNSFRNPVLNFEFALRMSTKPVICFSDQDDIWLPGKRELMHKQLEDATQRLIVMNGQIVDALGSPTGETIFERWSTHPGFWNNLLRNTFMGSSMAFTADLKPYLLPFPSEIAMHDWWIGLMAEKLGEVRWLEELTIQYRIHGNNASLKGSSISQKLSWRINMLTAVNRRLKNRKIH